MERENKVKSETFKIVEKQENFFFVEVQIFNLGLLKN